jgi:putative membrane protein
MWRRSTVLNAATGLLALALVYSGWQAYDRPTWLLEVAPALIGLPLLYATWRRFPLTSLLYALLFAHALVLIMGGMYTYARVPLGFEIQNWLGLSRNPYDKIGHFMQGFAPAVLAREILVRGQHVQGRKMLAFIVVCIVLAISATYELIEWAAALMLGLGADEFLGTQGDPWDTQSDMFMALVGAVTALLTLSRWHDRQIHAIHSKQERFQLDASPVSRPDRG